MYVKKINDTIARHAKGSNYKNRTAEDSNEISNFICSIIVKQSQILRLASVVGFCCHLFTSTKGKKALASRYYKFFSSSTHLIMDFILLINAKMPTIVGI